MFSSPHLSETAQPSGARDRVAGRLLGGPLDVLVGALCLVQYVTWVPHYLTWPWYSDHDVFGTMAYAWHRGLLPYRDLLGNNFPGALYLFWLLGRCFGWGKTYPLFAADAFMVAILGASTLLWSRRRLGRLLPGLVAFGTFLAYYLNLDYSQVAQRDWQAPFFAILAVQLAEAWPGRGARLASAAVMATSLIFRPQAVLFFPAAVLALDESVRPPGTSVWTTVRVAMVWLLAVAAVFVLEFLPLVVAGVLPDFLRSLQMFAFGGTYNRITPFNIARQTVSQLQTLRIPIVPLAVWLMAQHTNPTTRRLASTWLVAFVCLLLYAPLSPTPHAYLVHPIMIVWAMNLGVLVQVVLEMGGLAPCLRLTIVLLAMGLGVALHPRFSNPRASREAIGFLSRGEVPGPRPTGYTFNVESPATAFYPWDDYRNLLIYLRQTDAEMRLANALKLAPAITGPTARLPALPAESVAWLMVVRRGDESLFAESLKRNRHSLVIWSPAEQHDPRMPKFEQLRGVIERLYEPLARFGAIEVWRRKAPPESPAAPAPPP